MDNNCFVSYLFVNAWNIDQFLRPQPGTYYILSKKNVTQLKWQITTESITWELF